MKPIVAATAGMLVLSTIGATRLGGWAVVSVVDPPTHFVAGKAHTFDFVVRQHGEVAMGRLKPEVSAHSGVRRVTGRAWETTTEGTYRAALDIPAAGEWRVVIGSGFGRSRGALVPLQAIAANEAAPTLTASQRGRQLFAAKGCVSCHVHSAVDVTGEVSTAGPDLSDRRFAADYLARFLANPGIKAPVADKSMPNPRLSEREIAALVAFINTPSQLSAR